MTPIKIVKLLLCISATTLLGAGVSHAQVIAGGNGDFEEDTVSAGTFQTDGNQPGYTTPVSTVYFVNDSGGGAFGPDVPESGSQFAVIQASNDLGNGLAYGALGTTLTDLIVGDTYQLSLYQQASGEVGGNASNTALQVQLGSVDILDANAAASYTAETSIPFTATSTSEGLTIYTLSDEATAGTPTGFGIDVDNFTVTSLTAPEPSSVTLVLLGAAGLGLLQVVRRFRSV